MLKRTIAALLITIAPLSAARSGPTSGPITGPLSMLVPYPAGGPSDITARIVAEPLSRELNAPVVVENLGGASGAIAAQRMLNGATDGHVIYQGSQNELILPPLTLGNRSFKPSDFEIVHPITATRLVLVVRQGLPVKTLQDFVDLSRSRTKEPLTFGSPGVGSLYHLIIDSMAKLQGVNYINVPYKGDSPLMQDLMGDRIDFTVKAFSTTMLPLARQGRFRIIANLSKDKPRELADLPSLSDIPVFKDVDYVSNASYFVKKGTPLAIREQLNAALGKLVSLPAVQKALEDDGRRVPAQMSLKDAQAFYESEIKKYQDVVKLTGYKGTD